MKARTLILLAALALLLISAKHIAYLWTEYLWFDSLDYSSVFIRRLVAQLSVGAAAWLLFVLIVFSNVVIAYRLAGIHRVRTYLTQALHPTAVSRIERMMLVLLFMAVCVIGLSVAVSIARQWETVLKFIYAVPFNLKEPILGQDASTYMLALPFYNLLYKFLLLTLLIALVATVLMYLASSAVDLVAHRRYIASYVRGHISCLVSGLLLIKAFGYRLDMFKLLFDYGAAGAISSAVWGASYTDVYVRLPVLYVMMALAVFGAILLLLNAYWRAIKLIVYTIVLIFGASFIAGVMLPGLVQNFIVKPNELMMERKFISHNIKFTLTAYGLDGITVKNYPVKEEVTDGLIKANIDTIQNVRLWDYRPLKQVYDQLQEIRFYYDFNDVDVDRYYINGKYQQVMIAARELNHELLPAGAKRWMSLHLQYTHGYGVCMSPVNESEPNGMPKFYLKDIPPKWFGPGKQPEELRIERPEIYFGEIDSPYVIVRTKQPEIDYPKGAKAFKMCVYQGRGGVGIGSITRRILFALRFNDPNILLSRLITKRSRILYYRQITQRVKRIAPFLTYDADPYIVIAYGRLFWIIDAYTHSHLFPYSEPIKWGNAHINYIRNSVKAVVDAYNGDVNFYIVDPKDPLIRTYASIFPKLFKPISKMPQKLREHIRYPVDLIWMQATIYCKYHMTAPEQFYNREDEWEIANELFGSSGAVGSLKKNKQRVEPYYVVMRPPGFDRIEFVLMLPFTPTKKDNMISWVAAFCDAPRYGNIVVFRFPTTQLIQGPMQIEARIDQHPEISPYLSLWQQRGSDVIRGNLLVIPMDSSLLYVEPIYLRAEQSEIPQLARVVVASQNKLAMGVNLSDAIERLLGKAMASTATDEHVVEPLRGHATTDTTELVKQLSEEFNALSNSVKEGKWGEFGQRLENLGKLIEQLKEGMGIK
ncbi:MAG: UPF0182 family protein [Armatimonadota bacterium]|nr:UPF0182 family protein [Armatimonadota bacterium]MCX7776897.1 UPF0182 family protein [Armatimonadota bacterium]MDW8024417.1 UPF0182 family protein [Armatimonadota bacterium]